MKQFFMRKINAPEKFARSTWSGVQVIM